MSKTVQWVSFRGKEGGGVVKTGRRLSLALAVALLLIFLNVFGVPDTEAELFVGNFFGNQSGVLEYNGTTGAFVKTFVPYNSGGLTFPLGGAFGLDSNFYVSNSDGENVLRYSGTTGAFLNTFVTNAEDAAGLVFHSGNLYVANSSDPGAVGVVNGTTGGSLNAFVSAGSGGLRDPEGLVFGSDGKLYVGSNDASKVYRYDGTTGAFVDIFASVSGSTNFRGVVFGPDGNLYVTNFGGGDILRFDGTTGALLGEFVTNDPTKNGGLSLFPRPLVFGPDGNLYVGDYSNGSVLRYNGATGAFINAFVPAGSGGLGGPTFLVFDGQGPVSAVPEPSTMLLLSFGLIGFIGVRRKFRK